MAVKFWNFLPTDLLPQKDLKDLWKSHPCPLLDFPGRQTAQRVGKDGKGVVGYPQDPRHGPGGRNKGFGAKHGRGDSQLFKSDAVVQTAR